MAYPSWSVTHLTRCRSGTSASASGVQAVLRTGGAGAAGDGGYCACHVSGRCAVRFGGRANPVPSGQKIQKSCTSRGVATTHNPTISQPAGPAAPVDGVRAVPQRGDDAVDDRRVDEGLVPLAVGAAGREIQLSSSSSGVREPPLQQLNNNPGPPPRKLPRQRKKSHS